MRSNEHLRIFPILIRGSQEKPKVLSVEIDVGFLVIYFLLLSRRQMTRTAPRHMRDGEDFISFHFVV